MVERSGSPSVFLRPPAAAAPESWLEMHGLALPPDPRIQKLWWGDQHSILFRESSR